MSLRNKLFTLLVSLVFMAGSLSAQMPGDRVTVNTQAFAATDSGTLSEVVRASTAKDNVGISQMIVQGRVVIVPAGTGGQVLEPGIFSTRIRLDDGRAVWISSEFVTGPSTRPVAPVSNAGEHMRQFGLALLLIFVVGLIMQAFIKKKPADAEKTSPAQSEEEPETVHFKCPNCKEELSWPKSEAGNKIVCQHCGELAKVPRLRSCPDCGKQVSMRAPSCPGCGCPL